jgi:hypothetical protein
MKLAPGLHSHGTRRRSSRPDRLHRVAIHRLSIMTTTHDQHSCGAQLIPTCVDRQAYHTHVRFGRPRPRCRLYRLREGVQSWAGVAAQPYRLAVRVSRLSERAGVDFWR